MSPRPNFYDRTNHAPTRPDPPRDPRVDYAACGCGELFPYGQRVSCFKCSKRRFDRLGVWV